MPVQYIVDGYNVIFSTPLKQAGIEQAREILTMLVLRIGKPVKVVFDGREGIVSEVKRPYVVYTKGISADEYIKRWVKAQKDTQGIVVVTKDREIQSYVRNLGAKVMKPEEFYEMLQRKPRERLIKGILTKKEADEINNELLKLWELDEENSP
jgi:predicted RNA-binding protein with PIN domain